MLKLVILLSITFQILAVVVALMSFRKNPSKGAWLIISIALVLMTFRRFMGFLKLANLESPEIEFTTFTEETIALATSILLFLGIHNLNSLFERIQQMNRSTLVSERKYRSVFKSVSEALFITDMEGNIVDCNEASIRLLGLSEDDITGKNIVELFQEKQSLEKLIKLSGSAPLELVLVKGEGTIVYTEAKVDKIIINGEEKLLFAFKDLTKEIEAKKSKEYFEILLDSYPIPTFALNNKGEVVLWNKTCEELTNIPRWKVIGKKPDFSALYQDRKEPPPSLAELLIKYEPSKLIEKFKHRNVLKYGHNILTCESSFRVGDTVKIIKIIASRLFDKNEKFIGAVQVAQDITSEKIAHHCMANLQKMEAIGRLSVGVAHDFRNILMIIQSATDLIAKDSPSNPYIKDIKFAIERGSNLCKQLMVYSKDLEELEKSTTLSIHGILKGNERLLRKIFKEDVHFYLELNAESDIVRASSYQIDRIITNLLINAQDAMPEGGTLVVKTENVCVEPHEIPMEWESSPGDFIKITVKDTGIGMDEETLAHIFEPFFSKKGRGHGLGLYVVYSEVKKLKGFIKVESKPSLGTSFYVYLPLAKDDKATTEKEDRRIIEGFSKTILLIEDEYLLRKNLAKAIMAMGHKVIDAGSVREAIEIMEVEGSNIDLILTDFGLPEMNGFSLIKEIVEKHRKIPAIIMTGYADKAIITACKEANIPVIYKPFNLEELQSKIIDLFIEGNSVSNNKCSRRRC